MKKLICLLLAAMLLISLCGCSEGTKNEATTAATTATAATTTTTTTTTTVATTTTTSTPTTKATTTTTTTAPKKPEAIPLEVGETIVADCFTMTVDSMDFVSEYWYQINKIGVRKAINIESGYKALMITGHFENLGTTVIDNKNFNFTVTVNDTYTSDRVYLEFAKERYLTIDPYVDVDYVLYVNIPEKLADKCETVSFTIGFKNDMSPVRGKEVDVIYTITQSKGKTGETN